MKLLKTSVIAILSLGIATTANATLKNDKITLKNNMIVKYNKLPSSVNNLSDAFLEGVFYGRLRMNSFYWDWQGDRLSSAVKDNRAMGLGGSFIYKSAPYYGVSTTLGLYTSQNPTGWRVDTNLVNTVKAGKDTFSRYDTDASGNYGMSVLAQGYIEYDISKTSIIGGRHLFESVFTKSNDTKMIPNTFDGISATIKEIPHTTIKVAWLAKQKLRDHTVSHDVLAYKKDDPTTSNHENWTQNDDAVVNRNLTVERIGKSNSLNIITITNKSIKNLKLDASYAFVPDVLSNLVLEVNYAIPVGSWKIVPGVRYMQQFDNLGANYNVASLNDSNAHGYDDKTSLDTNLIATRLDFKTKAFLFRVAYSQVADEADIVTPWRGFPTGGYTRAMAQYNWRANTKTYLAKVSYDFNKANMLKGFSVMAEYAMQDFDDKKDKVQADNNIFHIDIRQNIGKNLQAKFRVGYSVADDKIKKSNGSYKTDISYNEYRFELNYFF
jgi:hypothetical protein